MTSEHNVPANKLECLTGVRGIAAWWVVFYHFHELLAPHIPSWMLEIITRGYLAVDLFFILSGFVIFLTYYDKIIHLRRYDFLDFYYNFTIRRLSRVYPLHLLTLFLYISIPSLLILTGRNYDASKYGTESFFYNLLLIQNWFALESLTWNVPSWSISAEWFAYLLFPFFGIIFISHLQSLIKIIAVGILLIATISFMFAMSGADSLGDDIQNLGVGRCFLQFMLGGVLLLFYKNYRSVLFSRFANFLLLSIFCGGLVSLEYFGFPNYYAISAVFGALILFLSKNTGIISNLLSGKALVFIGDISYSTYMWHFLLKEWFKMGFVDSNGYSELNLLSAAMLVLFGLSVVSYVWFERPAQLYFTKLGTKFLQSSEKKTGR